MNTDSLFFALNTEGGKLPERIMLLPAGEFVRGRDGRNWTKKDAELIAKRSNDYLPQHSIDENHSTDLKAPKGESSPASGWFSNIVVENGDEIWADVEWTPRGSHAITNKEYKYISPVFETGANGEVVKILRAALTNTPNLELPAMNSEQTEPADKPDKELDMKEISVSLGLPETASKNDIMQAINSLKTQANSAKSVDLMAYAPRADLAQMEQRAVTAEKALAELNAEQLKAKATEAVEKAVTDRKIAPASKDEYIAMCSTEEGLERFTRIMETTPEIIPAGASGAVGTPPDAKSVELNAEDEAACKSFGYTKEEWLKIKGGN